MWIVFPSSNTMPDYPFLFIESRLEFGESFKKCYSSAEILPNNTFIEKDSIQKTNAKYTNRKICANNQAISSQYKDRVHIAYLF